MTPARQLRWGSSFICLAVVALVAAPTASAHVRSGIVATDFRASLAALPAPLPHLIAARIYESDRAVRLSVAPGHTAVVLGYLGEPFVRVPAAGGVDVNASAPTAGGTGLLASAPVHSAGWLNLARGRAVTWHDNRVRALPPGVDRRRWTIPLVVDGRPARLQGELWRVDTPAWWPWLVMGVPFALVSMLVFFRRRSAVGVAAAAFGVLAAAGLIASGAGLALDTYASTGKWIELGNELALVIVGLAFIALGPPEARGIAGGALGLLGLTAGALAFPMLLHGVVLSLFPAADARALVALTLWSAAAAVVLGMVVFEDSLSPTPGLSGV